MQLRQQDTSSGLPTVRTTLSTHQDHSHSHQHAYPCPRPGQSVNTERRMANNKEKTLHTNQKNGHLVEFMHERVRTVRRKEPLASRRQKATGRRVSLRGWGGLLPKEAYGQQVAAARFPGPTKTKTETKTKMFFQLKSLRSERKIHLNCPIAVMFPRLPSSLPTHCSKYHQAALPQWKVINGPSPKHTAIRVYKSAYGTKAPGLAVSLQ